MASPSSSPALSEAEWEETLGVWLEAFNEVNLQSIAPFARSSVDHSDGWWGFDAPHPTTNSTAVWLLLREGMELLELLARVDPHTARDLLAPYEAHLDAQAEAATRLPRFQIILRDESDVLHALAPERLLQLFTHDGPPASAEFDFTKAYLWSAREDDDELDREVDGRVEIAIEMTLELSEEPPGTVYAAVRRLADAHTRNESRSQRERSPFTLNSLQFRLESESPHVPDHALEFFNQLAMSGVRISHFHFTSLVSDERQPALLTRFMLNQLMPVDYAGDRGVQSLDFNAKWFDGPTVHAFCTAIARSTSLRRISFEIGDDDTAEGDDGEDDAQEAAWWPWLAYALFSRDTDHAIEKVTLNLSSLTMEHVRAIRNVLYHDNPLALLYEDADRADSTPHWLASVDPILMATFVSTPTIVIGRHRESSSGGDKVSLQLDFPIVPCQVVRDRPNDAFIEFFLPGRGVCWADRSQVVEIKPMAKRSHHPVRELMISTNRQRGRDSQPVAELLQMIGGPLEKLRVYHNPSLTDLNLCDAILPVCSNLTYLEVTRTKMSSLDWLVNAPRTCKLKTLRLSIREGINKASLGAFFQALGDKEHPLTRSLRELRIDFSQYNRSRERFRAEEDATCKLFIAMLDANCLLERCELFTHSKSTVDTYSASFMAHNNEPVNVVKRPLSVAQRLSFLSVMTLSSTSSPHKQARIMYGSGSTTKRTPLQLTTEAVKLVFELAATPKRRKCKIL